jgi:hypothetical protein
MSQAVKYTETPDKATRQTSSKPPANEPSYLVQFQRGEGRTVIFCFLFVGGYKREFATFAGLAPLIGRQYSFYGVIARGTDGILEPHRSVEEMAAAYIQQIQTIQPQGPYLILGECFSASVAYETAQQLRAKGEQVAMLAFLDARVPGTTMNRFLGNRLTARVRYTMNNVRDSSSYTRLSEIISEIQILRKAHGMAWLWHFFARIRKSIARETATPLNGKAAAASPVTPVPIQAPVMRKSKQLQRSGTKYRLAVRRYERLPYSGEITIIASSEFYKSNPTMGWKTVQELQVHEVPGKHDTYLRDNQQMVVGYLRSLIEKAEKESRA